MKLRLLLLVSFSISIASSSVAQSTYLRMPIMVEDNYQPADMFISFSKLTVVNLPIKNYAGSDSGINKVKELVNEIVNVDSLSFKSNSVKNDSMVMMCFKIYSIFIPKAPNVVLVSYASLGSFRLYFIQLSKDFPLLTICLKRNETGWWNNPSFAQQPIAVALTLAVNSNNSEPEIYPSSNSAPAGYRQISFDTILNTSMNGSLSLFMNIQKVNFVTTDVKDSANVFPPDLKNVLDFYRNSLTTLNNGTVDSYFSLMTIPSKSRIQQSLQTTGADGINYYKKFVTQYVHVDYVINCGKVKILLTDFQPSIKTNLFHSTQITEDTAMKLFNENKHYYLNDLLNTKEVLDTFNN